MAKTTNFCIAALTTVLLATPTLVFSQDYRTVKYVADAYTIVLDNNVTVRLIGLVSPHPDDVDFAKQARAFTASMVLGKKVRLEFDPNDPRLRRNDRSGATLAYVFLDNGIFVNAAIVRRGFATVDTSVPFEKFRSLGGQATAPRQRQAETESKQSELHNKVPYAEREKPLMSSKIPEPSAPRKLERQGSANPPARVDSPPRQFERQRELSERPREIDRARPPASVTELPPHDGRADSGQRSLPAAAPVPELEPARKPAGIAETERRLPPRERVLEENRVRSADKNAAATASTKDTRSSAMERPSELQKSKSVQEYIDPILEQMDWGNIGYNYPKEMNLKETRLIQLILNLGKTPDEVAAMITAEGEKIGEKIQVSQNMEARLTGQNFEITAITPEVQAISGKQITEWKWEITPKTTGQLSLHLTVNALVKVKDVSTIRTIASYDKTIKVFVPMRQQLYRFVTDNWQWFCGVFVIPAGAWAWKRRKGSVGLSDGGGLVNGKA